MSDWIDKIKEAWPAHIEAVKTKAILNNTPLIVADSKGQPKKITPVELLMERMSTNKLAALLLCAGLLCSCASSGVKVDQSAMTEFTAGKSTCADVQARLGPPNVIRPSNSGDDSKTVWIYSYGAAQAHPENFIPVVGVFAGGYDTEATAAAFRFTSNCVLDGTRYASMNMGSGANMEGVAQARKDTRDTE